VQKAVISLQMKDAGLSWHAGAGPPSLAACEIHLWRLALDLSPERMHAFAETLSADERRQLDGIHPAEGKASFCICRGSLRMLLGRYTGILPGRIRLTKGALGKPSLDQSAFTTDLQFSVSHSDQVALIALAMGQSLGVDVQGFRAAAGIADIQRSFFSSQERESIRALPEELRAAAFHSCWTRKEAVVKALGGSIAALSRDVIVSSYPLGPARILSMPSMRESGEWQLLDLPMSQGYAASLCYEGKPAALFLWQPTEWG
jgi:4'-phosphopantetheinyl transferase